MYHVRSNYLNFSSGDTASLSLADGYTFFYKRISLYQYDPIALH